MSAPREASGITSAQAICLRLETTMTYVFSESAESVPLINHPCEQASKRRYRFSCVMLYVYVAYICVKRGLNVC